MPLEPLVVVAGATGKLGYRVVCALRRRGVAVRAIVRTGTSAERLAKLREQDVEVVEAEMKAGPALREACVGASCVVSTLLGLREVMVEAQGALLDAAVEAGVPRFIPSDYAMDFGKIAPGLNRNFDLHREFQVQMNGAAIRSTTILCGAFMDLLTGEAPLVLFKLRRVLYWGEGPEQRMDFTTMDDTAAFIAEVALDPEPPRVLRVAGEQINARELAQVAGEVAGKPFRTMRGGSLGRLQRLIRVTRALSPKTEAPFPVLQGMQYLYCMFEGSGMLRSLDNARYPGLRWTGVRAVLEGAARG